MKWQWAGLIGVFLGFFAAWGLSEFSAFLRKRLEDKSSKLKERRRQQRRDTEENIANRFANYLEPLLPKESFWVENTRINGIKQVNVGKRDENSFLSVKIDLYVEAGVQVGFREHGISLFYAPSPGDIEKSLEDTKEVLMLHYVYSDLTYKM